MHYRPVERCTYQEFTLPKGALHCSAWIRAWDRLSGWLLEWVEEEDMMKVAHHQPWDQLRTWWNERGLCACQVTPRLLMQIWPKYSVSTLVCVQWCLEGSVPFFISLLSCKTRSFPSTVFLRALPNAPDSAHWMSQRSEFPGAFSSPFSLLWIALRLPLAAPTPSLCHRHWHQPWHC